MKRFLMLAAVAAMALALAIPASAKGPKSGQDDSFTVGDAAVLGPVHVRGDVAQVHVRYSCDVGDFHVRGYSGMTHQDHFNHFYNLAEYLEMISFADKKHLPARQ